MKNSITLLIVLMLLPSAGFANQIMPDFSTLPTGWVTDRYAPNTFGNVGTFQGRDNVLGIGISEAQGASNRGGLSGQFYNTQGKQYALTGGPGSVLSADLWISSLWLDSNNGNVRTDMWAVMVEAALDENGKNKVSDYPIIGFTNYGGNARYRVYESHPEFNAEDNEWVSVGSWVNITSNVVANAWTSFAIEFTGTSYEYYINGSNVYSDTAIEGSIAFSATIMQAYNFYDTSIGSAVLNDYTAHWSNTPTPEPGTMLLMSVGALGTALMRRRAKKNS